LGELTYVVSRYAYQVAVRHLARASWLGLVSLTLFFSPALSAQEPAPPSPNPAPAKTATIVTSGGSVGEYVVGPQDLLTVSILESPELSREVRVAGDGTVGLALLAERVHVAGLTLSDVEDLLRQKYREGGILNQPEITVTLKDLQSKPVTVSGAVKTPGVFQVTGQVRLLRLLSLAGGFSEDVGTTVKIIREDDSGKTQILQANVEELRQGKAEANLMVCGGDTVNVMPAGVIYVIGAVNHPGRFLLRSDTQQTTILNVLALVEDLKRTAKPDKAVLIRRQAAGTGVEQIPVDIRKILNHKQEDVAVLANDVLYVPDSAAKHAFTRGLEVAIQLATGAVIYGVR
jgi:polysaccharide export outer membrane protein